METTSPHVRARPKNSNLPLIQLCGFADIWGYGRDPVVLKPAKRSTVPLKALPPGSAEKKSKSVVDLSGRTLVVEYALLILVMGALLSIFTPRFGFAIAAALEHISQALTSSPK